MHLIFIHETRSNNPLGTNRKFYIINFNIYYTLKDFIGFILLILSLKFINLNHPFILRDPENFLQANPLITPPHIQPE